MCVSVKGQALNVSLTYGQQVQVIGAQCCCCAGVTVGYTMDHRFDARDGQRLSAKLRQCQQNKDDE